MADFPLHSENPIPVRVERAGPPSVRPTADRRSNAGPARPRGGFALLLARECARLPARTLLALVWIYQRTLSPVLPVVLGPSCGCRFAPTCSHYAAEAVRTHGAVIGGVLALRRLLKCTPLHPGGLDPVPAAIRLRPTCRRAGSGTSAASVPAHLAPFSPRSKLSA